ncbi:DUF4123 domain-containing protein [Pseudomonas chlororaphis]|uniref:DUF4123 domain-containing protein n=1 Tax=Pseudomonas chlororaphis TaxID=587753 RepID=UPI0007B3C4EF|nr:DUF4123 domain-containing protein [Pseudomonas chlororaphis]AZC60755.1 hypothetical protein C4K33_0232 [Pseudomonas chlororaphis subsp. piscium]AZC92992.1 hypothetical protein C4K28_0233 [Pseudomonas chlororaphis subsp. piscium]KZO51609.1 hypothetical protein PCL1391_0105 [Pseudomonas chlororaphis subsp. piscium]MBP5072027.1 DUF4123 domain-containing protein [Pseudomonas chlororaphis]
MPSDRLTPQAWLAQQPLQADERLYLVISNASDADPLKDFYQTQGASSLTALWSGTPYADWQPVMPYLAELKPTSPFLDWIATTDADDWGWLAVSSCEPDVVFEHLRSLTQVKMPDGAEVFFRFWDGRHIYPILEGLGENAPQVLPIFDRYLINGRALSTGQGIVKPPKPFPWWEVSEALVKKLAEDDPSTVIDNMMQWLLEDHAELYFSFPESNLRQKVTRFVKRTPLTEENYTGLLKAHLENEVVA